MDFTVQTGDRKIQLSLYSLLDIAIHYEGATYAQAHKMLSSVGISEPSTTRSIYEYIVEEPKALLRMDVLRKWLGNWKKK